MFIRRVLPERRQDSSASLSNAHRPSPVDEIGPGGSQANAD